MTDPIGRTRLAARLALVALLPLAAALCPPPAGAQGLVDPGRRAPIEAVEIRVRDAGADPTRAARIEDRIRRAIATFPSDRYVPENIDAALARVGRSPDVVRITHVAEPGATGGVVLRIDVEPGERAVRPGPRGALAGDAGDFPVLYDDEGTLLIAKLESIAMAYGNRDAWYGHPGPMTAGNPFVQGAPAGAGTTGWIEGFVHAGLYGLLPLAGSLHAYGGASAIASGSTGRELFSDATRSHVAVEDAYVGLLGGRTSDTGDRLAWSVSAGRQRFAIGDGFLIANTATNGRDRAALQSNPRWAADRLLHARVAWNRLRAEAFDLDPDELPAIDTGTRLQGVNVELLDALGWSFGLAALRVPRSSYAYYTATEVLGREGLRVVDARMRWQPEPAGRSGPFVVAEAARQTNANFPMRADAWTVEPGWLLAGLPWSPTLSYRFASFSGDDPATERLERWDPLLSGNNGDTWVQGINHFKVFQNSNLLTHRLQLRLRPSPTVELVPQLWLFRADSTTNLGGNPALSTLTSKELGSEVNLTARVILSRRTMLQGHVAATFAGRAVDDALGTVSSPWISAMMFVRVGF